MTPHSKALRARVMLFMRSGAPRRMWDCFENSRPREHRDRQLTKIPKPITTTTTNPDRRGTAINWHFHASWSARHAHGGLFRNQIEPCAAKAHKPCQGDPSQSISVSCAEDAPESTRARRVRPTLPRLIATDVTSEKPAFFNILSVPCHPYRIFVAGTLSNRRRMAAPTDGMASRRCRILRRMKGSCLSGGQLSESGSQSLSLSALLDWQDRARRHCR